jgi:hypothetical protein
MHGMKEHIVTIRILTDDTETPLGALKNAVWVLNHKLNEDDIQAFKTRCPLISSFIQGLQTKEV